LVAAGQQPENALEMINNFVNRGYVFNIYATNSNERSNSTERLSVESGVSFY
jgi:hypothetical protein